VHDLSASSLDTRRALYALAGILSAYATMTFLVGEYNEPDIAALPEFAIADGIIEFSRRRAGSRDERFVRVLKLRGSSYHAGAHAFRITDAGLDVYPRLVTPSVPDGYQPSDERVSTGVAGLDAMLGGGLRRGSATLLAGPSGAGKTTIGLHFALDGVQRGEPTLYANFQENPTQLAHTIRQQGIDPAELPGGALDLVYRSPVELQIDSIIVDLFRRIEERQIQRVVIDAVSDLALSASDPQRLHEYLYSLVQHFAVRNVTALLTMETTTPDFSNSAYAQGFSAVADNIILLELTTDQRTRRTVRVVKARRSKVDPQVRELEITGHGARVI
jgi:circadian clock protein KaiC